jgi:phytoene dehydrogenase-like protein
MRKNVIIIGGGHNGLVTAAYLARAGCRVRVFEKRAVVGGCASSDTTTFPGYTISSASYLNSLFLPEIVRDFDLPQYGYEVLRRDPSSFTPLPDGRSLLLGPDPEFNKRQIAQFSKRDAMAYAHYEEALGEVAEWVSTLMKMTPPNIPFQHKRDVANAGAFWKHLRTLSPRQLILLARLCVGNPLRYLDKWFESDVLKATLLTDALIGAVDLNGYVLLHHVMGEAGGARGVWGYMRGGMGSIAQALARAAEHYGAEIYCNTAVERVIVTSADKKVKGVVIRKKNEASHFIGADIVISNLDPVSTFRDLLGGVECVGKARRKILRSDYASGVMKINCILSGLPNFSALPGSSVGPQHQGTIHLAPTVEYILRALGAYKEENGRASRQPMLELTIPSVLDDTLAPPGHHVMNIFAQFVPYGSCAHEETKQLYFHQCVLPVLRTYITNIDAILEGVQILSPTDLEREFGLTRGNIFHGGLGLRQLFACRPIFGMADYRTPIKGFYLCGSGTHPGGGVSGAPGYNASREILADIAEKLI